MTGSATSGLFCGSAFRFKRFHNPLLGDPATAQACVERDWAEDRLRERYDWMYRYDATAVAV
jgi:salicylate hydroxylase